MKILVVNPNTSETITARIRDAVERVKRPDTEVTVVCVDRGPETIESSYDEAYAIPPTVERVQRALQEGYDAVVLACFCDAGVEAAREVASIPVVAMEEATFAVALTLGNKFSILTEKRPRVAMKELHVRRAGLLERLASIRPTGLSVADLDAKPGEVRRVALELARTMVEEDGAEVIIMGCAAMAGYAEDIERELGVPVLDPTAVAFKYAEMIVDLGLRHSRVGLYHPPAPKAFKTGKELR